jgi:hypothetical protein
MMEIRRSPNISGFFLSLVIVVEYLRRHGHPSGPRPCHDEDLGNNSTCRRVHGGGGHDHRAYGLVACRPASSRLSFL